MLACRLTMLDLALPFPDDDRSPRRLGYFSGVLPIAYLPKEGKLVDEGERGYSTLKRGDDLRKVVMIVVNNK